MNEFEVILYHNLQVAVDQRGSTWLTQEQLAEFFDVPLSTIHKALQRAYKKKKGGLPENSKDKKSFRNEKGRLVTVNIYNLRAWIYLGWHLEKFERIDMFQEWHTEMTQKYIDNLIYDRDEYRARVHELEQRLADTQQDLDDAQVEIYGLYYPEEI